MILFFLFVISTLIVLLPNVLFVLCKILSLLFHFHVTYRPFGIAALVMLLLWWILYFYGNKYGRFFHETKAVSISVAHLPDTFDGYKVVQISDLHLDGWKGKEKKLTEIVNEVNDQNADVIFFTGDLVSLSHEELLPFVSILSKLKAHDGVFAVMGNHDYMPYRRDVPRKENMNNIVELQRIIREDLGWRLLLNENELIHRGGDSIAIIGCENQSMGVHNIIHQGNLAAAAKGTKGMAKIILTHDPTHWRGEILKEKAQKELDLEGALTLSGHTHSGQFRIFGFSVAAFVYDEYEGLYTEGNNNLYVNIGLGGTMPMRVGATPEITVIELKKD